ncbi:uncharacterized protein LOC128213411 isoform X2 [Mya arenaria]|uniref:uncharacterized protein LOC128213411 isoform X2 n=1 Tax=Mya arenaria TaxID=6604 RepID=UPI0022E6168E|nr:uncharacterized protein LOC128213411 isoform X2 [Mya arenaria]
MRILLIVFALGFLICLVTSRPRLPREPINVVIDGLVVISSPGYETDEYPGDTEQTWDLQAPAAKKVHVYFEDFVLEYHPKCMWDRLEIFNDKCSSKANDPDTVLCGTLDPFTFNCSGDALCLKFHSDGVIHYRGFKAIVSAIEDYEESSQSKSSSPTPASTSTSSATTSQPELTSIITELNEHTITVPTNLSETGTMGTSSQTIPSNNKHLSSTDSSNSFSHSSNSTAKSTASQPLTKTTTASSTATTSISSAENSTPTKTTTNATTNAAPTKTKSTKLPQTLTETTQTTPVPNHNQELFSSTSTSALGTPTSPFVSTPTSVYSTGTSVLTTKPKQTENHTDDHTVADLYTYTGTIIISDTSAHAAEIIMCETTFVNVNDLAEVFIKSPMNYNGQYPLSNHCELSITNGLHKEIMLTFLNFSIEYHMYCNWDYVRISDATSSVNLCGLSLPTPILSTSDVITITFHSDHIISAKGFLLQLSATTVRSTSPGTIPDKNNQNATKVFTTTLTEGSTYSSESSPSASSSVSNDSIDQNQTTNMATQNELMTTQDSATVISSSAPVTTTPFLNDTGLSEQSPIESTESTSLVTLPDTSSEQNNAEVTTSEQTTNSTNTLVPPNITPDNHEIVEFCNKSKVTAGKILYIVSPGYLNNQNYPIGITCQLDVESLHDQEIKISIRDFDLELQSACKWDYLSVQNSTFEVRFCGWLDTLQQITSYSSCSPNYLRTVNAKDNQQLCLLQTGTDVTLKATKSLRFVFRSDTVISKRGFKISLETLQTSNEGFDQTPVSTTAHKTTPSTNTTAQSIDFWQTSHNTSPSTNTTAEYIDSGQTSHNTTPSTNTTAESIDSGHKSHNTTSSTNTTAEYIDSGLKSHNTSPSTNTTAESIDSGQTSHNTTPSTNTTAESIDSGHKSHNTTSSKNTTAEYIDSGLKSHNTSPSTNTTAESIDSGQTSHNTTPSTNTTAESIDSGHKSHNTTSSTNTTAEYIDSGLKSHNTSPSTNITAESIDSGHKSHNTSPSTNITTVGYNDSRQTSHVTLISMNNSNATHLTTPDSITSEPLPANSTDPNIEHSVTEEITTNYHIKTTTTPIVTSSTQTEAAMPTQEVFSTNLMTKSGENLTTEMDDMATPATSSSSSIPSVSGITDSLLTTIQRLLSTTTETTVSTEDSTETTSHEMSESSPTQKTLLSGCSANNPPEELTEYNGYISSPGSDINSGYPPDTVCRWKIHLNNAKLIVVVFEMFDIEDGEKCQYDKLAFYSISGDESENKMLASYCGSNLPPTLHTTENLLVEFTSDLIIQKNGFRLRFYKTQNEAGQSCSAGRVPCGSGEECVPQEWRCDGTIDCADGSDEQYCSTCTENQFQCSNGSCIRLQLRCDGQTHCPFNEDETGCVTLSDGWSGGVAVQIGGEGHKLCFSQSMANGSTALCRQAGLRYATEVTAIKITEHTGKFASITDHGGNISFTSCESCDLDKTTLLACSDEGCGQKSNEYRKKRVIGGSVSAKGEWPWIVGLRIGSGNVICGGSIIGESWVLTAGHCVNDLAQNPQEVSIVSGVSDINDDSRQVRFASEIVIHPDYNFIYNADIALIRLQRPFTFTSDIRSICLPWDKRQFSPDSNCFIAGYGVWDMKDYYTTIAPRFLRHVRIKVISHSTCGELYSYKTYIRDSMMCAGYTGGGIDACKGDSGSGLMCEVDNGRWTLAGVVSWGDMCGQTNRPGVYTSVTAFVDWIDEVTVDTQPTVNCTFEDGWCGYTDASSGDYFWTRQPADKFIKGMVLFAARPHSSSPKPANATLITPKFSNNDPKCLSFNFMFSTNSNLTFSVYGLSKENENPTENERSKDLIWQVTSHYRSSNTWRSTEVFIPRKTVQLMMNVYHDQGTVFGLGLDNVTLSDGQCIANEFLSCDFSDRNSCLFTESTDRNAVSWMLKSNDKNGNYIVAGGNKSTFGFMAISQLISPPLTSLFTGLPHCVHFKVNKFSNSTANLILATYVSIGGTLNNQKIFWTSEILPTLVWTSVKITVLPQTMDEYFDHVVFEIRRQHYATDLIQFGLDDIYVTDGICV